MNCFIAGCHWQLACQCLGLGCPWLEFTGQTINGRKVQVMKINTMTFVLGLNMIVITRQRTGWQAASGTQALYLNLKLR